VNKQSNKIKYDYNISLKEETKISLYNYYWDDICICKLKCEDIKTYYTFFQSNPFIKY
jgi:hypothetical protein